MRERNDRGPRLGAGRRRRTNVGAKRGERSERQRAVPPGIAGGEFGPERGPSLKGVGWCRLARGGRERRKN
ncbi:MAG: hypothetical protein JRM77_09090 [Nitrososphaerota archaeon]|nr:hypothetical protein [Nitrososphaerota archaeon]